MVETGFKTKAYAVLQENGPLVPYEITRRAVGDYDVHVKITFASICHSDIHEVREEWKGNVPTWYPIVPGHEITGLVAAIGKNVTKFKVGDSVCVGCIVDSCRECRNCKRNLENYCKNGFVGTYNHRQRYPHSTDYDVEKKIGAVTYGGYSQDIVINENYVYTLPKSLKPEQAAPLLCAGITVYSPLKYYGIKAGEKLAVAGLGGLGCMAVKFGVAMGCHVTVISRGTSKKEEALTRLGAHDFLDSTNKEEWDAAKERFDQIMDTISADHDIKAYMTLLDVDGKLILVGCPPKNFELHSFDFFPRRKSLVGSLTGGVKETQEMLDFCGEKGIFCDVEVIKPDQINEAFERVIAGDVKYRFSIDVSHM